MMDGAAAVVSTITNTVDETEKRINKTLPQVYFQAPSFL